jgi:hypothetical protein
VLVAVSIIETLLLPEFVIYANGAAYVILISIKTKAVETRAIEYDFCLLIIHFNSFIDVIYSKNQTIISSDLD